VLSTLGAEPHASLPLYPLFSFVPQDSAFSRIIDPSVVVPSYHLVQDVIEVCLASRACRMASCGLNRTLALT
jgi:hypothetical protein